MAKKKKDYYLRIPTLTPYDNKHIYKQMSEEFGLDYRMIEYIIRTNFKYLRKHINENSVKDEHFNIPSLGRFNCYKEEQTEEDRLAKIRIDNILWRYFNVHINDEDVAQLQSYREQGYWIPRYNEIIKEGRRRVPKQRINDTLREALGEQYFIKHGAIGYREEDKPENQPSINKYKDDDDYIIDDKSDLEVF